MGLMKPRMSSYVDRGNKLIAEGKTKEAMNLVSHGLQYYSERVINSIEYTLKAGEKDRIIDAIDTLSGYESNIEEVAKN